MLENFAAKTWQDMFNHEVQEQAIDKLEQGKVLLWPDLSFEVLPDELYLLQGNFSDGKAKNISFNIANHRLRGINCSDEDQGKLKAMLERFAQSAHTLISNLFPRYAPHLIIGRTSFRPAEIMGRISASYKKDDTRLHVDAFPANPNQGKRILRVFTNINQQGKARVWKLGEPFEKVAQHFLPQLKRPILGSGHLLKWLQITKSYRTEYDYLMLQIHNQMKADLAYQKNVEQVQVEFLPGNTWIVQTDHVSHAALAGQHVLEQTFYLPVNAMKNPSLSPLKGLEKLTGRNLI